MRNLLFFIFPVLLVTLLLVILTILKIDHKVVLRVISISFPIFALFSYFYFLRKYDIKLALSGFCSSVIVSSIAFVILINVRAGEIFAPDFSFYDISTIAGLALSVAVFEEFIFRGLILGLFLKYAPKLPVFPALLLQALAFAASHFDKEPLFYVQTVLGGLFLGWTVIKTRSLWFAIGFHFGWDLITVLSSGYHSMNFGHLQGLIVFGKNYTYVQDIIFIAATCLAAYLLVKFPVLLQPARRSRVLPV